MSFGQLLHGHVLQGSVKTEFMIALMHHSTPSPHLGVGKLRQQSHIVPVACAKKLHIFKMHFKYSTGNWKDEQKSLFHF